MACFLQYKPNDYNLLRSLHVNIRRPSSTALRRQLSNASSEVLRLANQCIEDCITKEASRVQQQGYLLKLQEVRQLKRRLLRYSGKEEASCLRPATSASLTKLMQSTACSIDVMSKYNRLLAVKISSALVAEDIEVYKENYVQWNNRQNLNVFNSANFRKMQFRMKQSHQASRSELSRHSTAFGPRRDYSPLSTNRKKYW